MNFGFLSRYHFWFMIVFFFLAVSCYISGNVTGLILNAIGSALQLFLLLILPENTN